MEVLRLEVLPLEVLPLEVLRLDVLPPEVLPPDMQTCRLCASDVHQTRIRRASDALQTRCLYSPDVAGTFRGHLSVPGATCRRAR